MVIPLPQGKKNKGELFLVLSLFAKYFVFEQFPLSLTSMRRKYLGSNLQMETAATK